MSFSYIAGGSNKKHDLQMFVDSSRSLTFPHVVYFFRNLVVVFPGLDMDCQQFDIFPRAVCAWKLLFEQQRVLEFLRSILLSDLKSPVSCYILVHLQIDYI